MRKKISLLIFFIISSNSYSQIGINTSNPQQIFHVDGKSSKETTNPKIGVPSTVQQSDDVVITKKGQLGIGTISPTAKVDINNNDNTNAAIRIADGTQQENRVLTSDDNGIATWRDVGFVTLTGNIQKTIHPFGIYEDKYLGANITLPRGRWFVYIGMLVIFSYFEENTRLAARFSLFSSDTVQETKGFEFIGNSKTIFTQTATGFKENIESVLFSSGIIRVEVTDPSVTLYLWDVNTRKYGQILNRFEKPIALWGNAENYIFAIKEY